MWCACKYYALTMDLNEEDSSIISEYFTCLVNFMCCSGLGWDASGIFQWEEIYDSFFATLLHACLVICIQSVGITKRFHCRDFKKYNASIL